MGDRVAIERPDSCPRPGVVPAFDAGWNAHENHLDRETVEVFAHPTGKRWAVLAWDVREALVEALVRREEGES